MVASCCTLACKWHYSEDGGKPNNLWQYCQRPVFSLGVSQQYQTCENLNSVGCRSWERITDKQVVRFQMSRNRDLSWVLEFNSNILVGNYFFLKNYVTSEGAVFHNVLYYKQLPIACYQVSFDDNNYFETIYFEKCQSL